MWKYFPSDNFALLNLLKCAITVFVKNHTDILKMITDPSEYLKRNCGCTYVSSYRTYAGALILLSHFDRQ